MHGAGVRNQESGVRSQGTGPRRVRCPLFLLPLSLCLTTGCAWDGWNWLRPDIPDVSADTDTLVLRDGQLVPDQQPHGEKAAKAAAQLAGAHELYRAGNYEKACDAYHDIAENKKNLSAIAEEARFHEAECLRRMEKYPKAADTYHKTLMDFPSGAYREQCCQRLFDIANYWLEDTRAEMRDMAEKKDGKRFMVLTPVVHWEKSKPLLDEEGRAVEALEWIHVNDITGPLADKSLFLAGSVQFYRENYREADHYFTQLVEQHKNSPLAPQAIELGIISKHMGTGGPDYDGRKVAEARQLINTALANYPVLATEKKEFLVKQLCSCTMQQAEKDFNIAEFYRRTDHPGSAYFYYEIVRRRYPGSPFFDKATERMLEMRHELEKKHAAMPPEPGADHDPKLPAPRKPETAPPGRPIETAPAPRPVPPGGVPGPSETAPAPRPVSPPETAPAPTETAPPPRPVAPGTSDGGPR
jgi:outer membrane protein assembly factor BamD (BamD/ComL family)